jgi:hypothetical protein
MRRRILLLLMVSVGVAGALRWREADRAARAKELHVFAGVARLQDEGHHSQRAARRGEPDPEGDEDGDADRR